MQDKKQYLKPNQINLVKPKFRKMVKEAFTRNEKVPYGVILLSDEKITKKNIERLNYLVKKGVIKD